VRKLFEDPLYIEIQQKKCTPQYQNIITKEFFQLYAFKNVLA